MANRIALTVFVAAALTVFMFSGHLRKHRVDLPPGDRRWGPPILPDLRMRMVNPKYYDEGGRSLLKWLWIGVLVELIAAIAWLMTT